MRSKEKGGYLREGLYARGFNEVVLDIVYVPDLSVEGSLDEAMKGA